MADKFDAGQVALTGSAQQLSSGVSAESIALKNTSTVNTMYLGGSSSVSSTTGWPLSPGETITLEILNTRRIWVIGTAADRLAWAVVSP